MLLGASTKTDDDTTIGKFGSGWKFSLAWFARNLSLPIIYSGKDLLLLETDVVVHRDTPFEEIIIDGERSRITADFGKQDGWKGWMAVREVYSNALDAGECEFTIVYNTEEKREGYTTIYIPIKGELDSLMINFNRYFAHHRKPLFTCKEGSIFLKEEESELNLYYRNIRCINEHHYEGFKSKVDFSLNNINIKENRLIEYPSQGNRAIANVLALAPSTIIEQVLLDLNLDFFPSYPSSNFIDALTALKGKGVNFTSQNVVKIGGLALVGNEDKFVLPNRYFNVLVDLGLEEDPFSQFRDKSFTFLQGNFPDEEKAIQYYFNNVKLPFTVKLGVLTGYNIKEDDGNCYVNYKVFKTGNYQQEAISIASNLDSYSLKEYFGKIMN